MEVNGQQRTFNRQTPSIIKSANGPQRDLQLGSNQQQVRNQQPEQEMGLLDQFKQQMMKAWQPVPTLTKTIILFFIMSGVFLGIGIPMIILSADLSQSTFRYDNLQSTTCPIGATCNVTFELPQMLRAPVFVYYQIHNFYQNHRLYASSYSYDQLSGKDLTSVTAQQYCSPIVYNRDLYQKTSAFNSSQTLVADEVANPCGMIAYTIFNDTYNLYTPTGSKIDILSNGIAWPTDIQTYKVNDPNKMWYNVTDQRFMNWMRIAAMSDFRKLWGRIESDVPPGNYTLQILNRYDLSKIRGQKYFVLSTSNFFGSKSNFLSISYISVGSACLLMAFLFLMRKLSKTRKTE